MASGSEFLLSHLIVIKQFYFYSEFNKNETFKDVCAKFDNSGEFEPFKWPDEYLFSEHLRKEGETFKTFEAKNNEPVSLQLRTTKPYGQLRVLITLYRAGFVVLSIVHSIIPQKEEGKSKGKNLTTPAPLTAMDVNYLLEEGRTPTNPNILEYEVCLGKTIAKLNQSDLVDGFLKRIEAKGLMIRREPRKITKTILLWDLELRDKTIQELVEEHGKDLFTMFSTPSESLLQKKSKESIVKDLKSRLHLSSENRGFFFDSISMLIISPRKTKPNVVLRSQLLWLYQLMSLGNFLLDFYSTEVRRYAFKLVSTTENQYADLLRKIVKSREAFSLALEDLYWIENDLFRLQSANIVSEYKKNFGLEERLDIIQRRFDWIKERCTEALTAGEHKLLERRERSITNLTLIFAAFGLGDILATFIVWYLGYPLADQRAPTLFLVLGLAVTLSIVFSIFSVSTWYLKRASREQFPKGDE